MGLWKNRESIPSDQKKNPYTTTFVSNFLKQNLCLKRFCLMKNWHGYEDYSFISTLKLRNIAIEHIENPLFHLNLETSEVFFRKLK
jgi:hypothetical protein